MNKILSPEEIETMMNASVNDDLKNAVKALFTKGDIVEVRAWDKSHAVFTGRYNYGKTLIEMLELFDGDGECDVYYVLNPVGDKHGTRPMSGGGLCTWEADVPWRRRFLLDFDPKRDNKIATNEQWDDAYDTAFRAMTWLKSYGYKGIVMASSGNGCHLLVPCELPNDAASKELVRKVQRAVSDKFSTETVECECFPDANRLVRAYGSTNKKGDETDTMRHRQSMLAVKADGVDENPKLIMERIIAENPVAEVKKHSLGTGVGPFSRDTLYERLEAWADGWEGDGGEDFIFEETDRHDGFRVLCPGALVQAWPDGEAHDSCSDSLNDSTIVYVENGWPRFSCRHNHCGDGAEHGKKTWMDLQNFYDEDRKLHRIMDETDCAAKWNIEYVDDGIEDKGDADIDTLMDEEPARFVQVKRAPSSNGQNGRCSYGKVKEPVDVDEVNPLRCKPEPEPEVEAKEDAPAEDPAPRKRMSDMPESCIYGWLGNAARELETPLGFAYPAVLTVFAAKIDLQPKHVRPTLYTCLIGPIHCGKSQTIERAIKYLPFHEADRVKWTVPGSDRGLIKIFGDKKKDDEDKKDKTNKDGTPYGMETAKTKLLAQDELRNTIAKANIQGSSLPSTLCSLWSQDEAGAADKTGEHVALVRLNILGALKADDAEDFAECFGKETTTGLYDRFIFGLAPKGWKYKKWEREPVSRMPKGCSIPDYCYQMVDEWRDVDTVARGRLGEVALRVAYITSAANHDSEVTRESMTAALEFVTWQEFIRTGYKAGLGDSVDAQCTNAILSVLDKLEPGVWVQWRTLASKKNWYRKFSARTLSSTRDAMVKSGLTIEETIEDEDGKPKRTGRLRLHMGAEEKE
jgi:hypothetical protein